MSHSSLPATGLRRWLGPLLLTLGAVSAATTAHAAHDSYPRLGMFQFRRATPEWNARFDYIVTANSSSSYAEAIKALNPNVLIVVTRDWQYGAALNGLPSSWYVRDIHGEILGVYGENYELLDHTDFCPLSPAHGNLRYNQYISVWMQNIADFSVHDGVATDGVVERPRGAGSGEVDLDRNGVNDWDEHGQGWIEQQWLGGIHTATETLRADIGDRIIFFNSGRFHQFEWDNTNGLYLEHQEYTGSFATYRQRFDEWMATAPEPHVLLYGANRAPSKTDFAYVRYHLGVAMYGDAYFEASDAESSEHHYIYYYDEYDVRLGQPTGPMVQLTSTGDGDRGVWVRFFDHGAYVVNVDETQNVVTAAELESLAGYAGPYQRFRGGQDAELNDGSAFDQVALSGRDWSTGYIGDGILLVTEPTTAIADIFVDNVPKGTSPGSEGAELSAEWTQTNDGGEAWSMGDRGYQNQFHHASAPAGSGDGTATFRPTIGVAGAYEVFEWHGHVGETPDTVPQATNVPYTITYADGGTITGTIDQSQGLGQWHSLGIYRFDEGTAGNVQLTDDADGAVVADAFKWVFAEVCEPGATEPCVTDEQCPGQVVCDELGQHEVCEPQPAAQEICDNDLDDDCNGEIDDAAVCGGTSPDGGVGGQAPAAGAPSADDGGCDCRAAAGRTSPRSQPLLAALLLLVAGAVRRRWCAGSRGR